MKRWLLKRFKKQKFQLKNTHSSEALKAQVNEALSNLDTHLHKPWALLFGAHSAGKTSLLAHVLPKLIATNEKNLETIVPTKNIDWWQNEEMVFIDAAGRYCFAERTDDVHLNYWQEFLTLIKAKKTVLDNLCFVIDVPCLLKHHEKSFDQLLDRLEIQIHLMLQHWQPLNLHIIVSKCDCLSGFAEFFNNLSQEDQNQPFGFSLNAIQNGQQEASFRENFGAFLQVVNQRLITRLHYEPNKNRRQRIYDFPLQLESLQAGLERIIRHIPDSQQLILNNVFFCSSIQTTETISLITGNLYKSLNLTPAKETPLIKSQGALFVANLVNYFKKPKKIVATPTATAINLPQNGISWRVISYPIALAIILGATFIFHQYYKKSAATISTMTQMLSSANQDQLLSELNALQAVKTALNTQQEQSVIEFAGQNTLKEKANAAYKHYLANQFLDYLKTILISSLETQTSTDPLVRYNTLKIYLMFTHPAHKTIDEIVTWFSHYWASQFPDNPELQKKLISYLQEALLLPESQWTEQIDLVQQVREKLLNGTTITQFAFKFLQNDAPGGIRSLGDEPKITGVDLSAIKFPTFYAKKSFETIYKKIIPTVAKKIILEGSWVIGDKSLQGSSVKSFTQALQGIYLQHYLNQWQKNLTNIQFKTPETFAEQIEQIHLLSNPNSPLWQIYLDALKAAGIDSNPFAETIPTQSLQQLQAYLTLISQQPSPTKASYDAAVARFENNDDAIENLLLNNYKIPQPLESWVKIIADNSWKLILNNTAIYLDTLWKQKVLTDYDKFIKNRFPIFAQANQDIGIKNFNAFFGPGGTMQKYFDQVGPFIDTSESTWGWRELDGQTLPVNPTLMKTLISSSLVQKMFYSNKLQTLSFGFTLKPLNISSNTQEFVMNIGGVMIRYAPDAKLSEATWPGKDGNFVTLRFKNQKGETPTVTTTGEWAWLRLVNKSSLQSGTSPQDFIITFKLKDNSASYQLNADNPINPYLPDLLNQFRCPISIVEDEQN